jgi:hypothetical protein
VEVIYNEITGGASLGVFAAYGRHTGWSPLLFTPLGENSGTTAPDTAPFSLRAPTGAQPPVNHDASATINGYEVNATGCNTGALFSAGEPTPLNMDKTIWWTWFPPYTGKVTVDTLGSSFDTVLAVYDFPTPPFAPLLYASDDCRGGNGTSQPTFNATANTCFQIQVGSKPGGATGMVRLHLAPAPVLFLNDGFTSAISLGSSPSIAANGSNENASIQSGEPVFGVGRTIWYRWTAPHTGDFILNTTGSNFDTTLALYTGTAVNALALVQGTGSAPGQPTSLRFRASGGVTYRIAHDGSTTGRAGGTSVLNILSVPRLLSFGLSGVSANRKFNLTWGSEPYTSYRIQQSTGLATWTDVLNSFPSTGTQTTLDLRSTPADGPRQFFRVLRE